MAKRTPPKYALHRPSGQARVRLRDPRTGRTKDVYLGPHGSDESRTRYREVLEQWEQFPVLDDGKHEPPRPTTPIVAELVSDFFDATLKARNEDRDKLSGHALAIRMALRVVAEVAGSLDADRFGPKLLKECRCVMVEDRDWARSTVNRSVRMIVSAFAWGVTEEVVPAENVEAMRNLPGLRRGEMGVREGKTVEPVDEASVMAIEPHVAPQVWSLVQLGWLTGARMGELVIARPCDIDMSGSVWHYTPAQHKLSHKDKDRIIAFGPKCQAILAPYLLRDDDAFLFDPREAVKARRAATATKGKPRRSDQRNATPATQRRIGDHYDTSAVRKAIHRGCELAGVDQWNPHQLRHARLTMVRAEAGTEAASAIAGHHSLDQTLDYARKNLAVQDKYAAAHS